MQWDKLLSTKRLGREGEPFVARGGRTEFESDVGRIVFSGSFRRLGRKAQVHPLAPNDHVHTRLTHSLEVGHVGRALGKQLGFNIQKDLPNEYTPDDLGTIVHAACLAHDLGNPPFGHAGEAAMAQWFGAKGPELLINQLSPEHQHDIIAVEGNAQGFRRVAQTENYLFDGGLQLTYATLGTFHKYPWSSRKSSKKFGSFISEENILDRIGGELGLIQKGDHIWCRHPLAHLVEAADDICYAIMDLEDAVELRILSFEEVAKFLLGIFDRKEKKQIRQRLDLETGTRANFARLRGPVFDKVISGAIEAYMKAYEKIMEGQYDGNIIELLAADDPRRQLIFGAKEVGQKDIYTDIKKIEIEIGCYATFDTLLTEFCSAALNQAKVLNEGIGEAALSWKSGHVLRLLGDHAPSATNVPPGATWSAYQCLRRVIDFITGMTDNYAVYISKQLQGTAFSGVQRP